MTTTRYNSEEIMTKVSSSEDQKKLAALMMLEGIKDYTHCKFMNSMIGLLRQGNMIWFSWEDDQLKQMFSDGLSDTEIATQMNTTRYSVRERRIKLNLSRQQRIDNIEEFVYKLRQLIDEKKTIKQAAKELKVSVGTIGIYCNKYDLSFMKYGSDHHTAKVSAYDRAVISTLHDAGYMPEHIAKALGISISTVRCVAYHVPSTEIADLSKDERLKPLLTCEGRFGQYLTPAEVDLFNSEGLDAFMDKTGRSEHTTMQNFVWRQQRHRFEMKGNQ